MPITARTADGLVMYADLYRAEEAIFCRDCGAPMHYRRYVDDPPRVEHFAHNPRGANAGPRACSGETTPEHDNAKMTLLAAAPGVFDALAGALGKPEQDIEILDGHAARRRADVLFFGDDGRYPVAFEAQFSKIVFAADGSGRTVAERTADYHAAGVHVVWCFPDKRTAQEHIAAAQRLYGCVGVLSPDGTEVEFRGINALWLDKHPIRVLREREAWRNEREQERLRRAAGERVSHPSPLTYASTDRVVQLPPQLPAVILSPLIDPTPVPADIVPPGYVVKRSAKIRGWWTAYRPGTSWIDWAPDRDTAIELAEQHAQGG